MKDSNSEKSKVGPVDAPSVIYKLEYPVHWGDEIVEEIELKRLRGRHVKRISSDADFETIFRLAAKSSGLVPAFFDELDACDCAGVGEVISGFLDNGRKTGKTD